MRNPFDLIRTPVITEKASDAKDFHNKISFSVDPRAKKLEIKKAVEDAFSVKVMKVNILNVKGKVKRLGRSVGRRSSWKKAIVTLKEGDTIEVFDQV